MTNKKPKVNIKDVTTFSSIATMFTLFAFSLSWPAVLMLLAAILLTVLKVGGVVAMSWWVVTSPLWLPVTFVVIASFILVSFVFMMSR